MRQVRSHLTYANVMVTILAFLVLGGGSAVALTGSNTVFSDDITDNQVQSADVRNDNLAGGGLGATDLKPNAVGQSEIAANGVAAGDVLNGSLGTSEFSSTIPTAHVWHFPPVPNIPNNANTPLTFDRELYDTASLHDNSTNTGRLTAPVKGIYAVTAQADWQTNTTGRRSLILSQNDTHNLAIDDKSPTSDGRASQDVTVQVQLAAGDYVKASVQQTSGGDLVVQSS